MCCRNTIQKRSARMTADTDKASAILLEFMSEMKGWENKFATFYKRESGGPEAHASQAKIELEQMRHSVSAAVAADCPISRNCLRCVLAPPSNLHRPPRSMPGAWQACWSCVRRPRNVCGRAFGGPEDGPCYLLFCISRANLAKFSAALGEAVIHSSLSPPVTNSSPLLG